MFILSLKNLTVSTTRTPRNWLVFKRSADGEIKTLLKERVYFPEKYIQTAGKERPFITANHRSPVLETLCNHKHVFLKWTASS